MDLKAPLEVGIEVTSKCNQKCFFCIANSQCCQLTYELHTEQLKNVISQLSDIGVALVHFTGGEPLMRSDIFDVYCYAKDVGLDIGISTNGTLIHRYFKEICKTVDAIQISLNGSSSLVHNEIQGFGFQKTLNAIRKLTDNGIKVTISTVACQKNYKEIPKIFELATRLNVSAFHLSDLMPAGRGLSVWKDQRLDHSQWQKIFSYFDSLNGSVNKEILVNLDYTFSFLFNKNKNYYYSANKMKTIGSEASARCSCGETRCYIAPNGDVFPCPLLRNLVAGNIKTKSFKEIWNESTLFLSLRKTINSIPSDCIACPERRYCGGGCMGSAYNLSGSYLIGDPRCPIKTKK